MTTGITATVQNHQLAAVTGFEEKWVGKSRYFLVLRTDTVESRNRFTIHRHRRQIAFNVSQGQSLGNAVHLVAGTGFSFVRRNLHSLRSPRRLL
ncbi:hypothetical protein D3C86_1598250 [compost metagenome]